MRLDPNKDLQVNVIGVVDAEQVAVPYRGVRLRIEKREVYGGMRVVAVLAGAIGLFAGMAVYFFCRGRKLKERL